MSDWYCDSEPFTAEMAGWVQSAGLSFAMKPIENDGGLLKDTGFIECNTLDRNAWFTDFSRKLVDRLGGPDHEMMVSALGKAVATEVLIRAKIRAVISAQGQLRPGHMRGRKPS